MPAFEFVLTAMPPLLPRVAALSAVICLSLGALQAAHAQPVKRHVIDASDVGRLASAHPHARDLLEEGEAALAQGDARRAAELFEMAASEAPFSALAARRHCQALMELGDRGQALFACRRAVQREGSPLDLRALVRAILSGPDRPTFDDLHEVTMLAARAERAMPRQPWGYAAACDIARRLGDSTMLDACRKDLQRVAPDHAETRRALATVVPQRSAMGRAAGWGVIVLASIATLVDRIRRTARARVARVEAQPRVEA